MAILAASRAQKYSPAIIWPSLFLAGHCLAAGWLRRRQQHRPLTGTRRVYKKWLARKLQSGRGSLIRSSPDPSRSLGPPIKERESARRPEPGWIPRRGRVFRPTTEAQRGEYISNHSDKSRGHLPIVRGSTDRRALAGGDSTRYPS